jgi:hypothetical protein
MNSWTSGNRVETVGPYCILTKVDVVDKVDLVTR